MCCYHSLVFFLYIVMIEKNAYPSLVSNYYHEMILEQTIISVLYYSDNYNNTMSTWTITTMLAMSTQTITMSTWAITTCLLRQLQQCYICLLRQIATMLLRVHVGGESRETTRIFFMFKFQVKRCRQPCLPYQVLGLALPPPPSVFGTGSTISKRSS